jgi:hypothetical protein
VKFEEAILKNSWLVAGCEVKFEYGQIKVKFPNGMWHTSRVGASGYTYVPTPNGEMRIDLSKLLTA